MQKMSQLVKQGSNPFLDNNFVLPAVKTITNKENKQKKDKRKSQKQARKKNKKR